jgi:hypothetical protein
VPFAFALHHATYFTALLAGIASGAVRLARGLFSRPAATRSGS